MPSIRGYHYSLSPENRKMYNEKVKFTAEINPYSINAKFSFRYMEKWQDFEFRDMIKYLLFSTSRFMKDPGGEGGSSTDAWVRRCGPGCSNPDPV